MLVRRFVGRIWSDLQLATWVKPISKPIFKHIQSLFNTASFLRISRADLCQTYWKTAMENKLKKFSTIALFLALCSFSGWPIFAANSSNNAAHGTTLEPSVKETQTRHTQCAFLANAPDKQVVIKGDTLWGISQKFLEHPWCWPEVWGLNRQEIKNPQWIYPGQVIYFDRAARRLRLGKPLSKTMGPDDLPNVRLSPQIRSENLMGGAISTIPAKAIEPFLSQPVIFNEERLADAPRIVAANRSHIISGNSDKVYVVGDLKGETDFHLYSPSNSLIDPETNQPLGFEYVYVGTVKLIKLGESPDEAHTFLVTHVKEEVTSGDHLLPIPKIEVTNYVPHAPAHNVDGRVVSVYGGVALAGQNQTVSINRGTNDGIDIGTVLTLYRTGKAVVDRAYDNRLVKLPNEAYGTLLIYRVFNNVSYGLIMAIHESTRIGDTVKSPE